MISLVWHQHLCVYNLYPNTALCNCVQLCVCCLKTSYAYVHCWYADMKLVRLTLLLCGYERDTTPTRVTVKNTYLCVLLWKTSFCLAFMSSLQQVLYRQCDIFPLGCCYWARCGVLCSYGPVTLRLLLETTMRCWVFHSLPLTGRSRRPSINWPWHTIQTGTKVPMQRRFSGR